MSGPIHRPVAEWLPELAATLAGRPELAHIGVASVLELAVSAS